MNLTIPSGITPGIIDLTLSSLEGRALGKDMHVDSLGLFCFVYKWWQEAGGRDQKNETDKERKLIQAYIIGLGITKGQVVLYPARIL